LDYNSILEHGAYTLSKKQKEIIFAKYLSDLTRYHALNCEQYRRMIESLGIYDYEFSHIKDVPFLPVSLFKYLNLASVNKDQIFKTMTSSGTTGQQVSKIFLDKSTAYNQQKTLAKIMSQYIGNTRLPMIIIDSQSVISNREQFSARGAGILGFSIFGSKKLFALDNNMNLDVDQLSTFINENKGNKIFIFGFTYMIWEHFYKELKKHDIHLDLSNAILFHGGGWKKLENEKVSPQMYKQNIREYTSISEIHDYYGMVEQTGNVYVECNQGYLHTTSYSDILIRNPQDFSVLENGEKGLIQTISLLPESYPGHSLLTEDEGIVFGDDNCQCGKKGKYFKVLGRVKNAEIRGCSDTYANDHR
jgi:phenylacetate-coenzyme A ligase PaaK-like adenylate-forming protein